MRNLTVYRVKSYVACLAKMNVYIEDPEAGELDINGVLCRKIGELKNGEKKTFSITERAVRVYVIAGKISRNYCNDYCAISEGSEDIELTGKNRFDVTCGNAFRFDGVHSEEVVKNRKQTTRRGLVILIASCVLGAVIGTAVTMLPKPKTFAADEMRITLNDGFQQVQMDNLCAAYGSKEVAILVVKDAVADEPELADSTVEEYGALLLRQNQMSDTITLQKSNGLTYFEYLFTNPENGIEYIYFSVVYQSKDAYWLVQFVVPEEKLENYASDFVQWAQSVRFAEAF